MPSDIVLVAAIGALASVIAALCTLAGVILNIVVVRKVAAVQKATNSMHDEIVAKTEAKALQDGQQFGVRQERARVAKAEGQTRRSSDKP